MLEHEIYVHESNITGHVKVVIFNTKIHDTDDY